jgi:hypothetical protein
VKAFEYRRVKNDERDAADLADLVRMGRLPEAWIAPPATRELRELVRHRAKLVALRAHCKTEVHAVLAKCGVQVSMSDLFGVAGSALLDQVELPTPYRARIDSLRRVMDAVDFEIDVVTRLSRARLARDPGYVAVQRANSSRGAGRRDRRHGTVPWPRTVGALGWVDTEASRVRHARASGADHEAGFAAGAVGGGGIGAGPAQDHACRCGPGSGCRAAWPQHRCRGRGPPATVLRLLRLA